ARSFAAAFKKEALVLAKGDATSGKPRAALEKVRYAHLATHGWFAPADLKSVSEGKRAARSADDRSPLGWNPLLLSGLAFAGASREPKAGEEDGILTALEVSETDLMRLELAVLSACETGLGEVADGEGLLGMQRAFAAAGARSVVATLWQVDDEAARRFMGEFYSLAWDARRPVARIEALRRAHLAVLNAGGKREHPRSWAAFVLSGDWR
ncbi:MAG: CHAT domain-containing protein, partial [Gemmataceae bacterium]|nr:CHAT domain-containing protein [Gemmataceae bacterium]